MRFFTPVPVLKHHGWEVFFAAYLLSRRIFFFRFISRNSNSFTAEKQFTSTYLPFYLGLWITHGIVGWHFVVEPTNETIHWVSDRYQIMPIMRIFPLIHPHVYQFPFSCNSCKIATNGVLWILWTTSGHVTQEISSGRSAGFPTET